MGDLMDRINKSERECEQRHNLLKAQHTYDDGYQAGLDVGYKRGAEALKEAIIKIRQASKSQLKEVFGKGNLDSILESYDSKKIIKKSKKLK